MNCYWCGGKMERKTAIYHIDRDGYHILLDSVPAWVCTQCGEAHFEKEEVAIIQKIMAEMDSKIKALATS